MARLSHARPTEGLSVARLLMVLSSFSPLFVLWAIRGSRLVSDIYLIPLCAAMVVLPNVALWLRIRTARRHNETRELTIGRAEDHRDHILVYLLAVLLPLYAVGDATWRYLWSGLVALCLIVFLFWHLNLHYVNVIFSVRGYRLFTVFPPEDGNPITGKATLVVITRREVLSDGERLVAYRLSDSVYLEMDT